MMKTVEYTQEDWGTKEFVTVKDWHDNDLDVYYIKNGPDMYYITCCYCNGNRMTACFRVNNDSHYMCYCPDCEKLNR